MGGDVTPGAVYELLDDSPTTNNTINTEHLLRSSKSVTSSHRKSVLSILTPSTSTGEKVLIAAGSLISIRFKKDSSRSPHLRSQSDSPHVHHHNHTHSHNHSQSEKITRSSSEQKKVTAGNATYRPVVDHHEHSLEDKEEVVMTGVTTTAAGESLPLRPVNVGAERHRSISAESTEILRLSGDMRCFVMAETPLRAFVTTVVEDNASNENKRQSFVRQLFVLGWQKSSQFMLGMVVLVLICATVRLAVISHPQDNWSYTVLLPLGNLLIIFSPIAMPLLLVVAEALATADILSSTEVILLGGGSESGQGSNSTTGRRPSVSSSHPNSPDHHSSSVMLSSGDDLNEFQDEDIDDRAEDIADTVYTKVTMRRFWEYFGRVMVNRLNWRRCCGSNNTINNNSNTHHENNSKTSYLPVPLARSRLFETLGAISMVCFVDDDTVCESFSVTEEMFLLVDSGNVLAGDALSGKAEHAPVISAKTKANTDLKIASNAKGVVLDLHANPEAKGSRFENPLWWRYLSSLKPIGLNSLLTYSLDHDRHDNTNTTLGQSSSPSNKNNTEHAVSAVTCVEKGLVKHIREGVPMEDLRELSEEIGFNAADVEPFSRMLEVSVLAPGLENAHLLEDTHAWGQEESRRRGSLQPQVRGSVYKDQRGGGLQMMAQGDPSLLLNYCREYWDGSSITPFSHTDRREVLSVYDRWKLEDFDVVAFSYSPIPAGTLQPLLDLSQYQQEVKKKDVKTRLEMSLTPRNISHPTFIFVDPCVPSDLSGQTAKSRVTTANGTNINATVSNKAVTRSVTVPAGHTHHNNAEHEQEDEEEEEGEERGGMEDTPSPPDQSSLTESQLELHTSTVTGSEQSLSSSLAPPSVVPFTFNLNRSQSAPRRSISDSNFINSTNYNMSEESNVEQTGIEYSTRMITNGGDRDFHIRDRDRERENDHDHDQENDHNNDHTEDMFLDDLQGEEAETATQKDEEEEEGSEGNRERTRTYSQLSRDLEHSQTSDCSQLNTEQCTSSSSPSKPLAISISLDAAMDLLASDPSTNQAAGEMVAEYYARSRSRSNSTEVKESCGIGGGVVLTNTHSGSNSPTFKTLKKGLLVSNTTCQIESPHPSLHDQLVDMSLQPSVALGIGNPLFRSKTTPGEQTSLRLKSTTALGGGANSGTPIQVRKSRLLLNQLPLSSARQNGRASMRQLWSLLRQQVFLGMAASSVPVRSDVPNTMEDLSSAGIRFVYFSPRNMKRSKPVAEKIGLQFDWNCAISLRDLDDEQIADPHRHISNYADWDVLARMPHGVEAIKKHLIEVDNVPLLVSLYTDATPSTIKQMVEVFREYGEIVLTIGSGYKAHNYPIYQVSDVATSVCALPSINSHLTANENSVVDTFPKESANSLTRSDVLLSFRLIGLGTAVRKGRVILLNSIQALGFIALSLLAMGFIPPVIAPPITLLFTCIYVPSISLAIMHTADPVGVMKNTPRKNALTLRQRDTSRFLTSVFKAPNETVYDSLLKFRHILHAHTESGLDLQGFWLVQDVMSSQALMALIGQAFTMLERGQQPCGQSTAWWLYREFFFRVSFVALLHVAIMTVRAVLRECSVDDRLYPYCDAIDLSAFHTYHKLDSIVWVLMAVLPVIGVLQGYLLNMFDNRSYRRYLQFLRLEFDTKLGMHSPR
eukprot:gene22405-28527_t